MKLSEHFQDFELDVSGEASRVVGNARFLCLQILEPLREEFGALKIHSGFRNAVHNEAIGGVHGSFHLYDGDECAADFSPLTPGTTLQTIFDWMRFDSDLPFDHVILEHDPIDRKPKCIHVQAHVEDANRRARKAFLRATGMATDTTEVECLEV